MSRTMLMTLNLCIINILCLKVWISMVWLVNSHCGMCLLVDHRMASNFIKVRIEISGGGNLTMPPPEIYNKFYSLTHWKCLQLQFYIIKYNWNYYCNETSQEWFLGCADVHSKLTIFKMANIPMVTMNVQKIFFYLIVCETL